jgi:hypothetical protein
VHHSHPHGTTVRSAKVASRRLFVGLDVPRRVTDECPTSAGAKAQRSEIEPSVEEKEKKEQKVSFFHQSLRVL